MPYWLPEIEARAIALGESSVEKVGQFKPTGKLWESGVGSRESEVRSKDSGVRSQESGKQNPNPESRILNPDMEDEVWKEKYEEAERQRLRLIDQLGDTEKELVRLRREKRPTLKEEGRKPKDETPPLNPESRILNPSDANGFYQSFKARLLSDPQVLDVLAERPEIEVRLVRPTVQLDGETLRGKLAQLIAEGFFESAKNGNTAYSELRVRRGFPTAKPNVYRELDKLTEMGFLVKEAGGYQAVPEMKVRIVNSEL